MALTDKPHGRLRGGRSRIAIVPVGRRSPRPASHPASHQAPYPAPHGCPDSAPTGDPPV